MDIHLDSRCCRTLSRAKRARGDILINVFFTTIGADLSRHGLDNKGHFPTR